MSYCPLRRREDRALYTRGRRRRSGNILSTICPWHLSYNVPLQIGKEGEKKVSLFRPEEDLSTPRPSSWGVFVQRNGEGHGEILGFSFSLAVILDVYLERSRMDHYTSDFSCPLPVCGNLNVLFTHSKWWKWYECYKSDVPLTLLLRQRKDTSGGLILPPKVKHCPRPAE